MKADHRQGFGGQKVLRYLVEVFVVTPRQMNLIKPAARLVNAAGRLQSGIIEVGVFFEEFGIDHLIGVCAADGERIADNGPLWLTEETEYLSQVVNQSGQNEPTRLAVAPHGFGDLH
jgi:hypothetical protein